MVAGGEIHLNSTWNSGYGTSTTSGIYVNSRAHFSREIALSHTELRSAGTPLQHKNVAGKEYLPCVSPRFHLHNGLNPPYLPNQHRLSTYLWLPSYLRVRAYLRAVDWGLMNTCRNTSSVVGQTHVIVTHATIPSMPNTILDNIKLKRTLVSGRYGERDCERCRYGRCSMFYMVNENKKGATFFKGLHVQTALLNLQVQLAPSARFGAVYRMHPFFSKLSRLFQIVCFKMRKTQNIDDGH